MKCATSVLCTLLILCQIIGRSLELSHDFVPISEEILSKCEDKPEMGYLDEFADFSHFIRKRSSSGINISGNITTKWDVSPSDIVEVDVTILKLEGNKWKPTAFKGNVNDLCKSFYDKNTIYYPYTTQHVVNRKTVKEKCINTPGTTLLLEPFVLKISFSYAVPLSVGRHKAVLVFSAIDKAGVKRPRDTCLEIVGDIVNA
ncbi:uncharacterized protein LOC6553620 [Drosophila erecta]|uniref:GG24631 n=1 Tax=Drosophila erecta TaxID=7220 RepID=B3P000_DROER|nr:uncharacterized protein LOC6553620 [Drosophila erecta]EDV48236.1 uncharacterized protein Dere_GG24631 [Drosophila erecta]